MYLRQILGYILTSMCLSETLTTVKLVTSLVPSGLILCHFKSLIPGSFLPQPPGNHQSFYVMQSSFSRILYK